LNDWRQDFYCEVAETIIEAKGRRPRFFARRHHYRKGAELEWNNAHIWIEKRKSGIWRVSTPKGRVDEKVLLHFEVEDGEYKIALFNFNDVDIKNYKEAFKKVLNFK